MRHLGRPVARASIYRILDELERLRLVQRVQVGHDVTRYEPLRSGSGHHHHLVCDSCGAVTPFMLPKLTTVLERIGADAASGELWQNLGLTLYRSLTGFAVAAGRVKRNVEPRPGPSLSA